jgi:hypothetical protein
MAEAKHTEKTPLVSGLPRQRSSQGLDALKALIKGVPELEKLGIADQLVAAVKALPEAKQSRITACVESFTKEGANIQNQEQALALLKPQDLGIVLDLYKGLPTATRETLTQQLVPPEAQQYVPLLEKVPSASVERMAPLVVQLLEDQKKGEAIDAVTVAKLHAEFVQLPEPVKRGVVQALPEEARQVAVHVMDVTDGMTEDDVVDLLTDMSAEVRHLLRLVYNLARIHGLITCSHLYQSDLRSCTRAVCRRAWRSGAPGRRWPRRRMQREMSSRGGRRRTRPWPRSRNTKRCGVVRCSWTRSF